MPIRTTEYEKLFQNLLNIIFDENPVNDSRFFVESSSYEMRKALAQRNERKNQLIERSELPDWLAKMRYLPPYEQSILADLFGNPNNLAIIRGGVGSGKTSLIKFLQKHCYSYAQSMEWQKKLQSRYFLSCIDLQSLPIEWRQIIDSNTPLAAERIAALIITISEALESELFTLTGDDYNDEIAILYRDLLISTQHIGYQNTIIETVLYKLHRAISEKGMICTQITPSVLLGMVKEAINKLKSPQERLVAALLPFVALGQRHRAEGFSYVLILDNVDPLPSYLQLALYSTLAGLFTSSILHDSGFKIRMFLRLSSAIDAAATIPEFLLSPHCSPDPSDIIFQRLTVFLLTRDDFPAYKMIPQQGQRIFTSRMLELWTALVDRSGYFHNILNAVSGTNLRSAFVQIKGWCLDFSSSVPDLSEYEITQMIQTVRKALGLHICDKIGQAVGYGLDQYLKLQNIQLLIEETKEQEAALVVYNMISSILIDIIHDTGFIGQTMQQNNGPRRLIGKYALEHLSTWLNEEGLDALDDPYSMMRVQISRLYHNMGFPHAFWAELSKLIEQRLLVDYRDHSRRKGYEDRTGIDNKICHMARTFRKTIEGPISSDETNRDYLVGSTKLRSLIKKGYPERLFTKPNPIYLNRYRIARMLLDPIAAPLIYNLKTYNVFSQDNVNIVPICLRILYIMTEAEQNEPVLIPNLIEHCERHGYKREQLYSALEEMIQPDHELVYTNSNNPIKIVERLLRYPARPLRLSWAGFSYVNSLIKMPVYLQWALSRVREVHAMAEDRMLPNIYNKDNLVDRIRCGLLSLDAVIEDEYRRLVDARQNVPVWASEPVDYFRRKELVCQSASADLLFKSIGEFLFSLGIHSLRFIDPLTHKPIRHNEISRIVSLVDEFMEISKKWIVKHFELFQEPNEEWEHEYSWAGKYAEDKFMIFR